MTEDVTRISIKKLDNYIKKTPERVTVQRFVYPTGLAECSAWTELEPEEDEWD